MMKRFKQVWVLVIGALVVATAVGVVLQTRPGGASKPDMQFPKHREHLDHSAFFTEEFASGQDVTKACLECHPEAATDVMKTAHYQWLGDEVTDPRTGEKKRIGKRNLLNNFCIGIQGNWDSCTRCHAGYGWKDDSFDFAAPENVDCLVCHDGSGGYVKGKAGNPRANVNLLAAAKSVGYPKRDNCGVCHHYGGGGLGVKHGDLDATLDNPDEAVDVHMGRAGMMCIDCHGGHGHEIKGKAYSVSVNHEGGIGCTDCHSDQPHGDERLDAHTATVACQTCHIPTFANAVPTKMSWDWSKAGDGTRKDDPHHYLKIKGEFTYGKGVEPEYYWFDMTMDRYLMGDPVADSGPTDINRPRGARGTAGAKIWPFKVHRAKQPFDAENRYLIPPVTAGEGGYWHEFDWTKALELGAKQTGLAFSGKHDFTETRMYWPLSHMVVPKDKALQCSDCHGEGARMDWKALGYTADPMQAGGE